MTLNEYLKQVGQRLDASDIPKLLQIIEVQREALEKIKRASCCEVCRCHSCDATVAIRKCDEIVKEFG